MPFAGSVAAKVAHLMLMPTTRDVVDDCRTDAGSPCRSVTPSVPLWVGRLCARKTAPSADIDSSGGLIPGKSDRVREMAILWTREAYSKAVRYLLAALRKAFSIF